MIPTWGYSSNWGYGASGGLGLSLSRASRGSDDVARWARGGHGQGEG
ncbi:DUF3309 family protein [Nitrosospira sp. Is2]